MKNRDIKKYWQIIIQVTLFGGMVACLEGWSQNVFFGFLHKQVMQR
jgi:putative effector of murein hydrolase